ELRADVAFIIRVDNWFDYKWLGWSNRKTSELRVPPFGSNRVHSERRVILGNEPETWAEVRLPKSLHVPDAARPELGQRIDAISNRGAFIWYSGNTAPNGIGSLMLYLSNAEGYCWYATFKNGECWALSDECQITRRTLLSFEAHGAEVARTSTIYG